MPPWNPRAEQAVLGALIADNWLYRDLRFLSADDFADNVHAEIYAAIEKRVNEGLPADAAALKGELNDRLAEVGGMSFIDQLVPDGGDPIEDAHIIQTLSQLRL